jgi:hypothetical protein
MSVITIGIVVLTSIAAAVYVSWPLLVGSRQPETDDQDSERGVALDHLLVQKESIYSALKELEFDHAMGNLSQQDYQELVGRYEDRAIAVLKTIDHVDEEETEEAEDPVEREIAALRLRRSGPSSRSAAGKPGSEIEAAVAALRRDRRQSVPHRLADDIEEEVAALRRTRRRAADGGAEVGPAEIGTAAACPACGAGLRGEAAAFCSRCGVSLRTTCPTCRGQVHRDDIFCSGCGTALRSKNGEPVAQTTGGVDA